MKTNLFFSVLLSAMILCLEAIGAITSTLATVCAIEGNLTAFCVLTLIFFWIFGMIIYLLISFNSIEK